jgi:predicted phage tail protein
MLHKQEPALKTIHLHGDLEQKYGGPFELAVNTVREACNALALMIPGFREDVIGQDRDKYYKVIMGNVNNGFNLSEDDIQTFHTSKDIHIIPVVSGAKDRGVGKIIFGALLFGAGAIMGFGSSGFTLTGTSATTGVQVARLGVGIALAGVGQMLSPSPTVTSSEPADSRESFLFNGATNRSTQGCSIPLTYGKFMIGSVVVSAGIDTEDVVIVEEDS